MCVCLFSTLSRRVDALQISIIIIIIKLLHVSSADPLLRMSMKTAVENVNENRELSILLLLQYQLPRDKFRDLKQN